MSKPIKTHQDPWKPVAYDVADAAALQALSEGRATPEQQIRALKWIVEIASGTYDLSFRPGSTGDRDTAFAEGRRFVGMSCVKLTKLNLAALRSQDAHPNQS